MSQPFRLLDLPKEIQCMVWEQYFRPFDVEIIQHGHKLPNGDEAIESVVYGFGSLRDMCLLWTSPDIHTDIQRAFVGAFSGKLLVRGCPSCVFHRLDGRLPVILSKVPQQLVKHISIPSICYLSCLDHYSFSCEIHDPYSIHIRRHTQQTILDCNQFPMLKHVYLTVEDFQAWDSEMESRMEILLSSGKHTKASGERLITAARLDLMRDVKQGKWSWRPSIGQRTLAVSHVGEARYFLKIPDRTEVVLQFFEGDGAYAHGDGKISSGGEFRDAMVIRVSLGSSEDIDRYETVQTTVQEKHALCRCGEYTSMSQQTAG